MRVLLVEDDPVAQQTFGAMVSSVSDCEVKVVGTRHEALALADWPDLILLDRCLPDVDGDDINGLRALRTAAPQVAIVVLSASEPDDQLSWIREGAEDWIVKGKITADGMRRVMRTHKALHFRRMVEDQLFPAIDDLVEKTERFKESQGIG